MGLYSRGMCFFLRNSVSGSFCVLGLLLGFFSPNLASATSLVNIGRGAEFSFQSKYLIDAQSCGSPFQSDIDDRSYAVMFFAVVEWHNGRAYCLKLDQPKYIVGEYEFFRHEYVDLWHLRLILKKKNSETYIRLTLVQWVRPKEGSNDFSRRVPIAPLNRRYGFGWNPTTDFLEEYFDIKVTQEIGELNLE